MWRNICLCNTLCRLSWLSNLLIMNSGGFTYRPDKVYTISDTVILLLPISTGKLSGVLSYCNYVHMYGAGRSIRCRLTKIICTVRLKTVQRLNLSQAYAYRLQLSFEGFGLSYCYESLNNPSVIFLAQLHSIT